MSDDVCPVTTTPSEFWPGLPVDRCERTAGHAGFHYGEYGPFHPTNPTPADSSTTKENN